jgi:hypothetical protein
MNMRHGFLLLICVAIAIALVYGFAVLYIRHIDNWLYNHPRIKATATFTLCAVVVFLVGTQL